MRYAICLAIAGTLLSSAPARAAAGWERLGERRVDGRVDRDVIAVGARDGRFRRIMLKVDRGAIELFELRVTFGDGQVFTPETRLVFGRGSTSRVIDLPGDARVIRQVEFRYGNLPRRGQAVVELWGAAAGGGEEGFEPGGGWERLGERWVNGRVDRDVIEVGARDGRFRRVAIRVENSALEMFDVKIVFGDGEVFSPPTRLVFGRDSSSRVIDLPGDARVIRRVEFRYGNLPGRGRARVELWAK